MDRFSQILDRFLHQSYGTFILISIYKTLVQFKLYRNRTIRVGLI